MDIDTEMRRDTLNRKRRQKSKTVVFKKICTGLYISHEWGMSLSHEATWYASIGRKWELTWKESHMGLMVPSKQYRKFDTIAEARIYANQIAEQSRR